MASTVISEAIVTIAVIIAASIFASAILTEFQSLSESEKASLAKLEENIEVKLQTLFADSPGEAKIKVWIKNVGWRAVAKPLIGQASDLFLQRRGGTVLRIPYNSPSPPTWNYLILNDDGNGDWDPGETIEITIELPQGVLGSGDWLIRFAAYTGGYTQYVLSL